MTSYDPESESTFVLRIILLFLILLGIVQLTIYISRQPPQRKRMLIRRVALSFVIIVVVILTLMGRLPWMSALIAFLIPIVTYLGKVTIRFFPLLLPWLQRRTASSGHTSQDETYTKSRAHRRSTRFSRGPMSKQEARQILGINDQADEHEIMLAHRKLIQRVHPDQGGNDYLASQINQAKDTLLG